MSNYNRVILMGRLTRDPEVRYTSGNLAVCTFTLAVNRKWKAKDGEWQEDVMFAKVTIFDKRGEAFGKYHAKGDAAFVEGELRLNRWKSKEGENRQELIVVAHNWEFVGGKGGGGQSSRPEPSGGEQQGYLSVEDTPF